MLAVTCQESLLYVIHLHFLFLEMYFGTIEMLDLQLLSTLRIAG